MNIFDRYNNQELLELILNNKLKDNIEQTKNYPIIKFPPIISQYFKGNIPEFNPVKPEEPMKREYSKDNVRIFTILFFIQILIIITFYYINWFFLLSIAILGIFFYSKFFITEIVMRKREWSNKKISYEVQLENYNDSKKRANELKLKLDSNSKKAKFIIDRVKEISKKAKPVENYRSTIKGWSENFFERELKKIFKDNIYTNYSICSDEYSYMPDFTFYNKEILIDIEIDEPYSHLENKPIHYCKQNEYHIDFTRDKTFIKENWFVIRFTEKQVCETPDSCIKTISYIIYLITGKYEYYNKMENIDYLRQSQFWTFEKAQKMALSRYRNVYLKKCRKKGVTY